MGETVLIIPSKYALKVILLSNSNLSSFSHVDTICFDSSGITYLS